MADVDAPVAPGGLRVQVRYFAGAAAAAGTDEEQVDLHRGATGADLAQALGERHPGLVRVLEVASLLVEEVAVRDRAQLLAADERTSVQVDVLPPFAGG